MRPSDTRVFNIGEKTKGYYPITVSGHMLEWIYSGATDAVYWCEMAPFTATMKYKNFSQGRSSVRFIVVDIETGYEYSLMRKSFDTFIENSVHGQVTGEFIVVKRGSNYGLIFTKDL